MSTAYLLRVYCTTRRELGPLLIADAVALVAQTSTYHAGAWAYPKDPDRFDYGMLASFDVGLASPYAGRVQALRSAIVLSIRRAAGAGNVLSLDVDLLDADRADWYRGPEAS